MTSRRQTSQNKQKGRFAELHAAAYLCRQGCRILARNYRYRNGELDIVAKDSTGTILFVEVKSVWNGRNGAPASRVNERKKFRIWRTAAHFLHYNGGEDQKSRFDVIGIALRGGKWQLRHYPDAFVATRVIPEC